MIWGQELQRISKLGIESEEFEGSMSAKCQRIWLDEKEKVRNNLEERLQLLSSNQYRAGKVADAAAPKIKRYSRRSRLLRFSLCAGLGTVASVLSPFFFPAGLAMGGLAVRQSAREEILTAKETEKYTDRTISNEIRHAQSILGMMDALQASFYDPFRGWTEKLPGNLGYWWNRGGAYGDAYPWNTLKSFWVSPFGNKGTCEVFGAALEARIVYNEGPPFDRPRWGEFSLFLMDFGFGPDQGRDAVRGVGFERVLIKCAQVYAQKTGIHHISLFLPNEYGKQSPGILELGYLPLEGWHGNGRVFEKVLD